MALDVLKAGRAQRLELVRERAQLIVGILPGFGRDILESAFQPEPPVPFIHPFLPDRVANPWRVIRKDRVDIQKKPPGRRCWNGLEKGALSGSRW